MNQCVNRFKAKWQKIECIEATNGKISNDVYRNHIVQMTSFLGFIVFFSSGVIFWFSFHLILHHSVHRIKRHTHHYRKHKITSVRKHSQAERMSLKSVCLNVVSSEQCVLNAVRCVALLCFAMHFFLFALWMWKQTIVLYLSKHLVFRTHEHGTWTIWMPHQHIYRLL